MKFNENLRRIRRAKDITQEELSKKTGIHQTHISHYERGERKPSFDNLLSLSQALNCTIDELVKQG
jgi:transcriptional regulator with XRE-family HTH domain